MSDELDEVVDNIKQPSTWLRIIFIIGFCFALYVVGVVILFLTAAQVLFNLFSGSDNRNLRLLGLSLAEYVNQILRYITFNTDVRPFPFSPFPQMNEDSGSNAADGSQANNDDEGTTEKQPPVAAASESKPAARTRSSAKKTTGTAKKAGAARKKTTKKGNSKSAKPADDTGASASDPTGK